MSRFFRNMWQGTINSFLLQLVNLFQTPDSQINNDHFPKSTSPIKMWTPGKLSNAHGGSAPSLVSDLASLRTDQPVNVWSKPPPAEELSKSRSEKVSVVLVRHWTYQSKNCSKYPTARASESETHYSSSSSSCQMVLHRGNVDKLFIHVSESWIGPKWIDGIAPSDLLRWAQYFRQYWTALIEPVVQLCFKSCSDPITNVA